MKMKGITAGEVKKGQRFFFGDAMFTMCTPRIDDDMSTACVGQTDKMIYISNLAWVEIEIEENGKSDIILAIFWLALIVCFLTSCKKDNPEPDPKPVYHVTIPPDKLPADSSLAPVVKH